MKKKKSIVLIGAGLFVALFLFLLPKVLFSEFVLNNILSRINVQPGLTVDIENCTVGWRQGLTCSGLEYSDVGRGLHLSVDRVTGSQGILALLAAPKNLGNVRVQHPVLTLIEQPKKETSPSGTVPPSSAATDTSESRSKQSASSASGANNAPFWDTLALTLEVEEGNLVFQNQQAGATVLDGMFSGSFALAVGTIKYELQWLAGEGQGALSADGYINLPARRENMLDTLVARMQLQVSNLQISPLLTTIAGLKPNVPVGTGLVNGKVTVTGAGFDSLDMVGSLQCTDVQLSGGVLGQDHPWLEKVSLTLDGSKKGRNLWRVADLTLAGDPGKITVKGAFDKDAGQASITGNIQIPVLLTQFPRLLQVHEKTSVSSGELKILAELNREGPRKGLTADVMIDSIQGLYDKRPFSWEKAAALKLAAEQSEKGIHVEQLHLDTSFLQVNGKGDFKDFTLQAVAELEKAAQELGKIFTLQWSGSGTLSLKAASRLHDENRYDIEFQVESPEFTLLKDAQVILPGHPLLVKGRLNTPNNWLQNIGSAELQVDGTLWPGTFSLHAGDLQRLKRSIIGSYVLSSQVRLELLNDLLRSLQLMPEKDSLAGEVYLTAAGFLTENQVVLRDVDLRAGDFLFLHEDVRISDDQLLLRTRRPVIKDKAPVGIRKLQVAEDMLSWQNRGSGLSAFDRVKRQLFVRNIELRSELSDLDIDELIINDVQKPLQSWRAELQGQADFQGISALLADTATLPPDLNIKGRSRFVLLAEQLQAPHAISFDLDIPRCLLELKGKTIVAQEPVRLSTRLGGLLTEGDLTVRQLELDSPPLALRAEGALLRTEKKRLLLHGEQTVDFSKISDLLKEFHPTEVTLQGRMKKPFELSLPLTGEVLAAGSFSSTFLVDSLNLSGIAAEQLSIPLRMENGSLHGGGHGVLNGGRLDVDGSYLFIEKPPYIAIPPGQVLSDVQLDQALTEGILAKVHPLFGVLAKATGTISARIDNFSWPVVENGKEQAKFTTVFDTSAIELVSHGVLQEILALMQVNERSLTLQESELTCNGEQGRVSCTPVKISVAESEMTISGSMGMDQTLDYLLEIPVTKQLVGREGFRLLEGATIKVPLRGTLGEPNFNKNLISEAISELVGQAAETVIEKEVEKLLPGILKGLQR